MATVGTVKITVKPGDEFFIVTIPATGKFDVSVEACNSKGAAAPVTKTINNPADPPEAIPEAATIE